MRIYSALSLIEPWATLMAIGAKRVETRSWATAYRGPFAIHASRKLDKDICREEPFATVLRLHFGTWNFLDRFRLGEIVGVAELLHCETVESLAPHQSSNEIAFGNYDQDCGRFGFVTDYATLLPTPIPARGMLNFWPLKRELQDEIARQLPNAGFTEPT